jgi:hypothetical protein
LTSDLLRGVAVALGIYDTFTFMVDRTRLLSRAE